MADQHKLSQEQISIISKATAGASFAVSAYAGAGKTSTLLAVARAIEHVTPDKRIIYLAFNKSVADEAQQRFGALATCETVHRFAKRNLRQLFTFNDVSATFAETVLDDETAKPLVEAFFATADNIDDSESESPEGKDKSTLAQQYIDVFLQSGSPRNTTQGTFPLYDRLWELIMRWVEPAPGSTRPSINSKDFDFHVKLLQLIQGRRRFNYDVILYDECQDCSGAMFAAVQQQPVDVQRIYVGDPFQAIYGFRGAINAFENIASAGLTTETLSQSFRFGSRIAELADLLLRIGQAGTSNDTVMPALRGVDGKHSTILKIQDNGQIHDLVIGKENATLLPAAASYAVSGQRIEVNRTFHKTLVSFLDDTPDTPKGKNARQRFSEAVSILGNNERTIIGDAIARPGDLRVRLSTVHSIKGDESPRVLVLDDLGGFCYGFVNSKPQIDRDILNLTYVAITRAQEVLDIHPMVGRLCASIRLSQQWPIECERILTFLGVHRPTNYDAEERPPIPYVIETPTIFTSPIESETRRAENELNLALDRESTKLNKPWQTPVKVQEEGLILDVMELPNRTFFIFIEQEVCLKSFPISGSDARATFSRKGKRAKMVLGDGIWTVRTA